MKMMATVYQMKLKEVIFQKTFIPSVQKGFEMAMLNGVLAGYPLNSLKVRLYDGFTMMLILMLYLLKYVLRLHLKKLPSRHLLKY